MKKFVLATIFSISFMFLASVLLADVYIVSNPEQEGIAQNFQVEVDGVIDPNTYPVEDDKSLKYNVTTLASGNYTFRFRLDRRLLQVALLIVE